MTTVDEASTAPVGRVLDEAPTSLFHLKAALTSGMGFLTDSYDLNIISTALLLLTPQFHLSSGQVGLVGSTALIASFVGAVIFGRIADVVGRKKIYGLEALIMVIGALATAFAPNFAWLLVTRFILGIGIGGDYPVSATIMTEYANRRNRGKQVALMFFAYVVGQIVAYIVALILLSAGISHDLAWRLMLGLGALPALAVLYRRRHMPESPRYTDAVVGDHERAARELDQFAGTSSAAAPASKDGAVRLSMIEFLTSPRFLFTLLGTGGAWFAFDVAVYGNSISQPEIVKKIAPHATLAGVTSINLILALLFSVTGYVCCILLMDRVPRLRLQIIGFAISGVALALIGLVPAISSGVVSFALVFGVASFGVSLGPNAGTQVLAAESFPVAVRATGHGISAGLAKVGAYIGALSAPALLASIGLRDTELIAAAFYLLGIPLTMVLREPAGRSLDELEALATKGAASVATPASSTAG